MDQGLRRCARPCSARGADSILRACSTFRISSPRSTGSPRKLTSRASRRKRCCANLRATAEANYGSTPGAVPARASPLTMRFATVPALAPGAQDLDGNPQHRSLPSPYARAYRVRCYFPVGMMNGTAATASSAAPPRDLVPRRRCRLPVRFRVRAVTTVDLLPWCTLGCATACRSSWTCQDQ